MGELQVSPDQMATLSFPQLQSAIDKCKASVEVLKPIEKKGRIIDFEIIMVNNRAERNEGEHYAIGRKIAGTDHPAANMIERLIEVAQNGSSFENIISAEIKGNTYDFKQIIYPTNLGLIISREKIDTVTIPVAKKESTPGNLQSALENLKRVADSSHDALISMDTQGLINYWNPAAEKMFKFTLEEVQGNMLDRFIIPDNKKGVLHDALKQVHEHGKSYHDLVTQKKDKAGKQVDVLVNIFPLRDEGGKIIGSCISMKDITEQKKTELQLKEDIHLINQIVDTTPDIIYIMDLNTQHIIYTNRQVAADLGYSKQQIGEMKHPIFDIMLEEDKPAMDAHIRKMKTLTTDVRVLEIQYRLKDVKGGINWFCDRDTVFKRNSRGVPVEKLGICQDITLRKIEEERVRTTMGIIQQSEQVVSMGSWEYDIKSDELRWSDGMYHLFNLDKEIKVRPEIYLAHAPQSELHVAKEIVNKILKDHSSFEDVITLLLPGQEKKLVKIKAVVQYDSHHRPVKVIGVDLDITEQVKAAEEIKTLYNSLLKNNDELQQLGHEIKTFNIIAAKVYKETLQQLYTNLEYIVSHDARNLSDSGRANIRRAQAAIQRMNLITDDINTYFALYDLEPQISYADVNNFIGQVISEFTSRLEQHEATIEASPLPSLPVDHRLFVKLIRNLVGYAIKHRNPGEPLVIKIRASQEGELQQIPSAKKNTPYSIISISYNGPGIPGADVENIFDLFHAFSENNKNSGPGVALAICKKIMAMHDGFVVANSLPDKTVEFACYFPLLKDKN